MKSTVERTDEEEILQILGEKSPVGVCIIQDGKFCYFNSNFPIAIGYTADELLGKDPLELIVPEDREMVRENEIRMLKGELLSPYQFRVIHKDGSIRWVTEAVRSIQYHGRRAVLGNYMEVTERKQMEEALKESEEKYRELANSITNVFFAMDEHLRYTYWNEASEILTGIRAEDAIGKSIREIFPDEPWRRRAEKMYRKVLKTQQPQTFVNDYDIDNRHYDFEISAYPSRGGIAVFVKDITERKLAEEKLKLLSSVTQQVTDATMVSDTDFNITYVNKAAQDLFGYSPEEMLGKRMSTFNAEPLPKSLEQELEQTVSSGKQWVWTLVKKRKDGSTFLCECHINPLYDTEGKISSYIDVLHDITERKQAEEALRQSEERYRTILEEMEDSYFEVDLGGHLTFVNSATCRKLGYSKEELIGMSYKKTTLEDDIDSVFRIFNKVYRTGKPNKNCVWTTVCKDGTHRLIEHSAFPLQNDKGEIIGFRGVGRDITERKQTEEKLQRSKEKYRALFDSSVIGTLVVDAKTMQVMIGNQAAVKMFGFSSAEEGTGVNLLDFVPPEEREKALELLKRELFEQNSRRAFDLQAVTKDGRTIWISATGARIMHKDRLAGLLCFTDVTERKQAEEALRRSEERYRTILEAMEDSYFEVDLGGHLTFVNSATCRALGYSREELIGKSYKDYTAEEDIESVFQIFNEVYQTGVPNKGFAWKTIRKDGAQGFAETSVSPLRNDKGEIIGFRGVGRDVTERKQTEEKLRQSEENYRALFDSSVIGTFVLDAETMKVVMGNEAAMQLAGLDSPSEGIGINPFDFVIPEDRERILEIVNKELFEQDLRRIHEFRAITKDGRKIWISITGARIMNRGKLAGLISFTDITERKLMEEALQAEKNKLQSVIDAMQDALTIQDRDYNIIYQNEPARISSGDDCLGEKCYWVYEGNESICEDCPVEKAFKDGKTHTSERQRVLPSGEPSFWETIANPIRDAEGKVISCLEIGRNITDRKKQEQALADELTRRRILIDQSLDGIVVLDVDAKVVEANQRFAEMLGYTPEEVQELHTWDWDKNFPPEKILEMGRNVDEKGLHLETKHTRKDGSVIDVDISINASMFGRQKLIFCVCRDVTERKKAEQALADELTRRRILVDQSLDGIHLLDEDAKVVEANQRFAEMLGYTPEEVQELHTWDWDKNFPPEKILEMGRNVDEKGLHLETKHTRKDGSVIDVDISISKITYGGQRLIFCISRDITERNRAGEALRQSEEKYRALFNSAVVGTIVIDAETTKLIVANQAAAEMLGFSSPEELVGLDALTNIPPEDKEGISELMVKDLFEQDLRKTREFRVTTKDGREIWISANASRIIHEGRLAGLISFTDITERKRAEEALRLAAEEWRETFDSITDAISIHDKDFRIMRANKAFADLFRKDFNEIINIHCYELHKGKEPRSGCPHQHTLTTGKPATTEFYESHLGKYLLESTSPIFNEQGEVVATVHITRDITEQKQQRERLMMTDRLASLGELAAGTAHELNNPLTSIIGFSQLLMEKEVPDDIRDDLKLIHSEAQRAANVTKDLLTFARKHAPMKQPNQINSIIDDVLQLRALVQKNRGIEIERHLAPDLPEIMADYFQMQQVFLNIIINAEYFMTEAHKKGTLTITTKKQNNSIMISFADDGPGISSENLTRIFDPFFTTKEAGKGTGLGLSICHGIVTEHGGQIYVRSQLGKGSTIFVELPIKSRSPY